MRLSTYSLTATDQFAGPFEAPFTVAVNINSTMATALERSLDGGTTWALVEAIASTGAGGVAKNAVGNGLFRVRATANGTATVQIL
jgi:hypothetical protein